MVSHTITVPTGKVMIHRALERGRSFSQVLEQSIMIDAARPCSFQYLEYLPKYLLVGTVYHEPVQSAYR